MTPNLHLPSEGSGSSADYTDKKGRKQEQQAGAGIVFPASACCFWPCFGNLCNKPTTSCFLSKNLCCQESNIGLSELKRSSHHLVPLSRDAIVVGFEDLVDQFVCTQ